jgi:hypothetical protein
VKIVESEVIPVAYTAGRCRFLAKAAGDWKGGNGAGQETGAHSDQMANQHSFTANKLAKSGRIDLPWTATDIARYRPTIRNHEWHLSEIDLDFISTGTYLLGCGGGGDPTHCLLAGREKIRAGHSIRVAHLKSFPREALFSWGGFLGSPEVTTERMFGDE